VQTSGNLSEAVRGMITTGAYYSSKKKGLSDPSGQESRTESDSDSESAEVFLPMVLTIAESQDKLDFELSTLPALVPVLSSASGETLLLLVKHAGLIINKASQEHLIAHVLPLLVRAYDDADVRI
jgi:hypothetical protein